MALTGRVREWKDILDRNCTLSVAYDRQQHESPKSTPFNICLKAVDGVIPKGLPNADYRLKVNLFDLAYKQFFGRTWTSEPLTAKTNGQRVKVTCGQNVYFHTSLNDESVAMVVEVVATGQAEGGKRQQVSCGWGLFRIFRYEGKSEMLDSSSAKTAPTLKIKMYHGSPRALFYLDEPIEGNSDLSVITGCQVDYQIRTHHYLEKAMHLIPENVVVGSNDVIPGLADAQKDPKNPGAAADPLRKPRLLKALPAFVERINVNLAPSFDKFEEEFCRQLNEDRINRQNKVADGTQLQVLKRAVYVGVHNGWTYVAEPEMALLTVGDSAGLSMKRTASFRKSHQRSPSSSSLGAGGNVLVHKNRVELDGLVQDYRFAVIFNIVYEVGEQLAAKDRRMSMAQPSYAVSVRWAAVCPLANLNSQEQTLQLIGGAGPNPDGVFMFHSQSAEAIGSSASMSTMTGGTVSFSFSHTKKGKENMVPQESLQVPGMMSGRALSQASVNTEASSVLQEAQLTGRPPLPHSSPRQQAAVDSDPRSDDAYIDGFYIPPGTSSGPMQISPYHSQQYQSGQLVPPLQGLGLSPPQTAYMQGATPRGAGMYSATPRGYIPVEIQHYSDGMGMYGWPQGSARMGMSPDLQELPFTPVHAPIMATIPGMQSGQGLSRAAYARLYTAGFPPVLDRHGEAAEVVDPADELNFVLAKEEANRLLKTNEIILQFMAFSRLATFDNPTGSKNPSTVFFTFQFYRFPQVTSERLLLGNIEGELSSDPASLPCLLQKFNNDGSTTKGNAPGYQVKYYIDPAYLKPGEGRLLLQHMAQQTLHIDVWDGDSLHLIGSSAVELKHLCRQGREAVQVSYELDVVYTEYIEHDNMVPSGDLTRDGTVRPVDVNTIVKGKLHLRMGNVGHPGDQKLNKADTVPQLSQPKIVVQGETGTSFLGGSLNALNSHTRVMGASKVAKAQHVVETNQELAQVLFTHTEQDLARDDSLGHGGTADRKRKLARMQALRQTQEKEPVPTIMSFHQEKENRQRDLKTIELYRHQSKKEGIINMLNHAITTEHTIHPSMGHTEFFEFTLKNPYNTQHTVTVDCDDPELFVITDPREWRHYKMLHEVYTSVEEGMFNTETKTGRPEIFLRPKENVNVPFKFLSFKADQSVHPQAPSDPHKPQTSKRVITHKQKEDPLQTRQVKVFFKTEEGKPIAVLALRVEPQPHIIDQTFRFHHPEQSFLKKSIRLPPLHTLPGVPIGGPGLNQIFVRCSDPNVICDSRKVQQGEPLDVFLKVACGASPQIKRFYVCVYTDPYMSQPITVWQFYVHAMQRVDVSCVEGQTSRFTLILRGTHASRLVQCFPSHSVEMQVQPREPFMLAANALQELHVGVRPSLTGSKFLYIHVVDIEYHQLVRSWLVCVSSRPQVVSKAFELLLPVGGGGRGSNKRISYTNPYGTPKLFHLRTNRQDLLQFKEPTLDLAGGEKTNIGLRFAPSMSPGSTEILVFINDEDDKTEETFCVKAVYQ